VMMAMKDSSGHKPDPAVRPTCIRPRLIPRVRRTDAPDTTADGRIRRIRYIRLIRLEPRRARLADGHIQVVWLRKVLVTLPSGVARDDVASQKRSGLATRRGLSQLAAWLAQLRRYTAKR
jgi:hypothetical protein